MKRIDKMLESVREKPVLVDELREKMEMPDEDFYMLIDLFLTFGCISIDQEEVSITPMGLEVLDLPDLPE